MSPLLLMFTGLQRRLVTTTLVLAISTGLITSFNTPSLAMIGTDAEGINMAIRYGMENGGAGLYSLLGPNWIEGPNGSLLNIYTPFMLIASRVARGGFSNEPTEALVKQARKRYQQTINLFTHPREPALVKFSVSMLGPDTYFARNRTARIEGYGRGQRFQLRPARTAPQKFAHQTGSGTDADPFDAINGYYFEFERLKHLEDYQLIIEDKTTQAEILRFSIHNDKIY